MNNESHAQRNVLLAAIIALGVLFGAWWWQQTYAVPSQSAELYEDMQYPAGQNSMSGSNQELPAELQAQPATTESTEPDDLEIDLNNTTIMDVNVESL